ncbi:hypothetical protein CP985_13500 [Malaciobacter mytili LMG 24559]|uniref:Uncharacterized protein n=1 Tax=Malaciobacter mytili LMG 24559 TaxID=1032238 RepID=A0AAX2AEA2_9BACT|nr:hypothetical protein [Malaciobacter mytili]AXH16500.1 hypothetical protein AMYT_a0202 [Malaciobacter mytili LMG 24559]RXK13004.1 hypothetical protein CP985_13500 [Malaciobacter mytili LMG 24559]
MKRVLLTHKDYPENFNKLAKYISKNWNNKLPLEKSRQLLATWLGYNSIFELEKSFVKTIPGLVDINSLMRLINEKMSKSYKDELFQEGFGYCYVNDKWSNYETSSFSKIPFYLIESLDKSKQNNFLGVYEKVAEKYPLFIENYRFSGYYGLFAPNADAISTIEGTMGLDKTMQLKFFLDDYECFPFGSGDNHISVLSNIQERVNKYFDEEGNWKIEVFDPSIEWDEDEEPKPLLYFEVWNILLEWFKELDEWYIIDSKKNEKHWLFKELDRAIKELKENDYKKIEKNIKEKEFSSHEDYKKVPISYWLEEMHSIPNLELHKLQNELRNNPRLNLKTVDIREETEYKDCNGNIIKDEDKLFKNGNYYRVEKSPISNNYYIYNENDLNEIFELSDVSTSDLMIVPKGTFFATQSIEDLDSSSLTNYSSVGLTVLKSIQTANELKV